MFNATLHEIISTRVWMMQREAFANYCRILAHNLNEHIPSEEMEFKPSRNLMFSMGTNGQISHMTIEKGQSLASLSSSSEENSDTATQSEEESPLLKKVLVLDVTGPITRNGDYCTVSSVWQRDLLMEAAQMDDVAGAVFFIDTPGGSSFSLHDYRQGLDAFKEAGKRTISFIDGMCCSAGVALACQTDYITVFNKADYVGCIGSMISGWTVKDGTVDNNGYRYIEMVASQSPDKNLESRMAAEGDYKLLQEELDTCAKDFLDLIEEMRPAILPEQRTGKTYRAGEVMGSLVDGVATLDECINYVLTGEIDLQIDMTPSSEEPTEEPTEKPTEEENPEEEPDTNTPDEEPTEEPAEEEGENPDEEESEKEPETQEPQKSSNKQYREFPTTASAIKEKTLNADNNGGLYLQPSQAAALEETLVSYQALKDQQGVISNLQKELQNARCSANEDKKSILQNDNRIKELESQLKTMNQTVTDLTEELGRLNNNAAAAPHIGESPANNGQSSVQPVLKVRGVSYNPNISPIQNAELRKRMEKALENMAYNK